MGVQLQRQPGLAQGYEGRRIGRPRRRLLFPQRHRAPAVRRARQECADARARPQPGQHDRDAQARAQPQARRAVRDHRSLLAGAVSRIVRARRAAGTGRCGATRPTRRTSRPGTPTPTIPQSPQSRPLRPGRSASPTSPSYPTDTRPASIRDGARMACGLEVEVVGVERVTPATLISKSALLPLSPLTM